MRCPFHLIEGHMEPESLSQPRDFGQDTAEPGFQLQSDFRGLSGSPGPRWPCIHHLHPSLTPGSCPGGAWVLRRVPVKCQPRGHRSKVAFTGLCTPEVSARGQRPGLPPAVTGGHWCGGHHGRRCYALGPRFKNSQDFKHGLPRKTNSPTVCPRGSARWVKLAWR